MGQCFQLPDDENLQREMGKHAHNHQFIFDQYNFDVETRPGSDMDKAERLWRRKQARHPPFARHACSALDTFSLTHERARVFGARVSYLVRPSMTYQCTHTWALKQCCIIPWRSTLFPKPSPYPVTLNNKRAAQWVPERRGLRCAVRLKALEAREEARKQQLERRRLLRLEKRKGSQRREEPPPSSRGRVRHPPRGLMVYRRVQRIRRYIDYVKCLQIPHSSMFEL